MEERRTLCILFAQVVGLAERPEAERAALADRLFTSLRTIVERHGGTVDKFIGDVVMVVFGAPIAHEDDASRAARAALEMALATRRGGEGLELRVGVNRGEVLWGGVGGDRATAMGDAVNVAQRIIGAAEPGRVLATAAVEELARTAVEWRSRPALSLKGRSAEVEVFEALGNHPGRTERKISPGARGAVLGREAELALFDRAFRDGERILLEGSAGVGKSRLLAEARSRLRATGPAARVRVGRFLDNTRLPYSAFAELLGEFADAGVLAQALPGPTREQSARLIAESLGWPGVEASGIEPRQRREATHAAWQLYFQSIAPVVLCVEDLHWADDPSLALLAHLAAALPRTVAIVATARPGTPPPSGFRRLVLGDLDEESAGHLAASALGGAPSPELRRFIAEKAAGNPYYVEELARFLRVGGRIEGNPLRLAGNGGAIPDGLQGLLVARLDALGVDDREAIKGASVIGRYFWEGFLARLMERDAVPAIEAATRNDMIAAQVDSLLPGDRQHAFRHALLRDAAYSLLTRKARARLHSVVARQLVELKRGRRFLALAAGHHEAAGDLEAAGSLWHDAAHDASLAGDLEESVGWARESARVLAGRMEAAKALLTMAESLRRLARTDERDAAIRQIEELLGPDPGPVESRTARHVRASNHRLAATIALDRGDFASALHGYERLTVLGRELGAVELEAGGLSNCGLVHLRSGQLKPAAEQFDRALDCARRYGLADIEILVLMNRSSVGNAMGRSAQALADAMEAHARLLSLGRPLRAAQALVYAAQARRSLGDLQGAIGSFREAADGLRRAGDKNALAHCLNNLGSCYMVLGKYEEAERLVGEGIDLKRQAGDRLGELGGLATLANLVESAGRHSDALKIALEVLASAREIGDRASELLASLAAGNSAAALGEVERGIGFLQAALALASTKHDPDEILTAAGSLGAVLNGAGRAAEAISVLESLVPGSEVALTASSVRVLGELSRAYRAAGRLEEARSASGRALAEARRLGMERECRELEKES